MKFSVRCTFSLLVAALLAGLSTAAWAETWTLDLKRQDPKGNIGDAKAWRYWSTQPQHFFLQTVSDGKGGKQIVGNTDQTAFKRIVKKEPEYKSDSPFRLVAKLGAWEYAFVLDAAGPEPKPDKKVEQADAKKTEEEEKPSDEENAEAEKKEEKKPAPKPVEYNRLYFDFNRNGDLTDDPPVEADAVNRNAARATYVYFQFPRIDVTLGEGDEKYDYSFKLMGYTNVAKDFAHASIRLQSAAYREGEIALDGKKHRVALIDFNGNGRFDDEIVFPPNVSLSSGQLYFQTGDMLLVDPDSDGGAVYDSPYDPTSGDYRHFISKMVQIDGRFYDLKVSVGGDKLTLTPSTAALGQVTNPNDKYRALIYGDLGVLKICGGKDAPAAVPAGRWRLLCYTLYPTAQTEPEKPAEADKPPADEKPGGVKTPPPRPKGPTFVSAMATGKYPAVEVREGTAVELQFGPPLKPTVTAHLVAKPDKSAKDVNLSMSLVGSAGEICTNIMIDGGRPPKPEFTITDPKGEVVQRGSFEYG